MSATIFARALRYADGTIVRTKRILSYTNYNERGSLAMIALPRKYALQINSPTPITSERQHEEYLAVLDKLASKGNPTSEEEKC